MKPSLLTRHLYTKHSDLKDKNVPFFKHLLENQNKCNMRTYLSSCSANEDDVEASFRIIYCISPKIVKITLLEKVWFYQKLKTQFLIHK